MPKAIETNDLLTLIGTAIEQLQQSVELFEASLKVDGITCLSSVIQAIDAYIDRSHEDPLLQLAHLDESHLAADLTNIKSDLNAVIHQFAAHSSS